MSLLCINANAAAIAPIANDFDDNFDQMFDELDREDAANYIAPHDNEPVVAAQVVDPVVFDDAAFDQDFDLMMGDELEVDDEADDEEIYDEDYSADDEEDF